MPFSFSSFNGSLLLTRCQFLPLFENKFHPSRKTPRRHSLLKMANEKGYCISLDHVKQAATRIHGVAVRTPVLTSRSIIRDTGKSYFFKVEALQRTGSFKFRGALNAVKAELESVTGPIMPVVTHSSGNHGQGLALAARLASTDSCAVSATIVMPESAPMVKKRAVASLGATIVECANTQEAREEAADRIVHATNAVIIHSSQDARVIAGQGTVCTEFVEQVREMAGIDLDAVIIPVGGGGLASGSAIALRGLLGDKVKVNWKWNQQTTTCNFDRFPHICVSHIRSFSRSQFFSMTRSDHLRKEHC